MTEDFVTYDLAVKLKEKGFREKCLAYYTPFGGILGFNTINVDKRPSGYTMNFTELYECYNYYVENNIDAPTISQVLKWLREYKDIYCLPYFEQGVDMWFYAICKQTCGCEFPEFISKSDYDTYEQAAIAGIEYVLNNLI